MSTTHSNKRIKIIHCRQQLVAVDLGIVVLIQKLGEQQVKIMPIKVVQAVHLMALSKSLQLGEGTVRLGPHQAVDDRQFGISRQIGYFGSGAGCRQQSYQN